MLSSDQQKAWDLILTGKNVFVTARAGAGKSFLVNFIRENYQERILVTASTGIAANAICGRTLHSVFRINPATYDIKDSLKSLYTGSAHAAIKSAKLLLIDEISMVSEGLLRFVDEICKAIRHDQRPFGGLQLAFFGDFLQLPPVSKNCTPDEASCWGGDCWSRASIETVLLVTNFRQKSDPAFYSLLNNLRYNQLTQEDTRSLFTRIVAPPEEAVRLFATNQEVDIYNQQKFNLLDPATERTYTAHSKGKQTLLDAFWRSSIIPEQLIIRLGARVMMCINKNTEHGYLYNGACGTVVAYTDNGFPQVEFDSGLICPIEDEVVYSYILLGDSDVLIEYAEVVHVPLKLAWACTVHKSQGQTFDAVAVDCSRVFDYGQVYVALSRARSLRGLYISNLNVFSRGATSDAYIVDRYLQLERAASEQRIKSLVAKYFS